MIKAENLSKTFERSVIAPETGRSKRETFFAVKNVSLSAEEGEIVGLLGPNGAGKTTLLRMLGSLMTPDEGIIKISTGNGDIITDPVERKAHIGYLSGNTKLYGRLTAREMMRSLSEIYGMKKENADARIEEICEIMDMSKFIDNRIEKLSTGQSQRVSIARTLIHDPEIYIFDEPTLGLDIISAQAIVSFMKSQKGRGKTVMYSTHYLEEAQFLCDRVLVLYDGSVIKSGTPSDLIEKYGGENLRQAFFEIISLYEGGKL
ncbi:MAG: ABC transporter ATP-binding protein [Lachnospiraceae bacterium]|nr:ABC transporter ATP-binding protein [Lachnospiraceae bacterium]